MRVAWPRKTGRTPAANGSRVPPWPTRRTPVRRRTMATMSCEVGSGRLGHDEDAVELWPSSTRERRAVMRRAVMSVRRSSAIRRRPRPAPAAAPRRWAARRVAPGSACMASATEDAGEGDGVHAAVPRAHAHPRLRALVLEEDGHLAGLRLREQVDEPLGQLDAAAPAASRSSGGSVDHTQPAVVRPSPVAPARRPNRCSCALGLVR